MRIILSFLIAVRILLLTNIHIYRSKTIFFNKKLEKLFHINTGLPEQGPINPLTAIINNEVAFGSFQMTYV